MFTTIPHGLQVHIPHMRALDLNTADTHMRYYYRAGTYNKALLYFLLGQIILGIPLMAMIPFDPPSSTFADKLPGIIARGVILILAQIVVTMLTAHMSYLSKLRSARIKDYPVNWVLLSKIANENFILTPIKARTLILAYLQPRSLIQQTNKTSRRNTKTIGARFHPETRMMEIIGVGSSSSS